MGKRRTARRPAYSKVTLTLPAEIVEQLDDFADEFDDYISRSELVTEILSYVMNDADLLDELFPVEED